MANSIITPRWETRNVPTIGTAGNFQWGVLVEYNPSRRALQFGPTSAAGVQFFLSFGRIPEITVYPGTGIAQSQDTFGVKEYDYESSPAFCVGPWYWASEGNAVDWFVSELIDDSVAFRPLWKQNALDDMEQSRLSKAIAKLNATKQRLHRTLISRRGLK